MAEKKGMSFNPENAIEGGGLADDYDAILQLECVGDFTYGGTQDETPGIVVSFMDPDDEDVEIDSDFYSAGNAKDWQPNKEGTFLVAVGNASEFRNNSNIMKFMASLANGGFPTEKMDDGTTVIDGTLVHILREAIMEKVDGKVVVKKNAKGYEMSKPMVQKVLALPGEKPKKSGGGKKAAASDEGPSKAVLKKATNFILGLIESEDGDIVKKILPKRAMTEFKKDPDRDDLLDVVYDDEFLGAGPWNYADGVLTAAE